MTLLRTWAVLTVVFATVVLSVRVLTWGTIAIDAPTAAALLVVPMVQVAVLAAARRFRRRR